MVMTSKERVRKYQLAHPDRLAASKKKWNANNRDKIHARTKRQRMSDLVKYRARTYASHHKLMNKECSRCSATKDLHFHHTNYEKNKGFTLCRSCHSKEHNIMLKAKT